MAFKLKRRSFLQLAAGAAAGVSAPFTRAVAAEQRRGDDRLAERRADLGSQSALHARRAADLQGGVRSAARSGPAAETDSAPDQELDPGAGRPEHGGRAARRRHVPQRRQDDDGGFSLHVLRAHQSRPETRHREFLEEGRRHRHRIAHQGDHEIQRAGADRAAMDGVPRQLHGAEEIYRDGRPR